MTSDHKKDCYCDECQKDNFGKDFTNTIQWNSEPLIANPFLFLSDWWDSKTWMKWHSLVKAKYGQKRANEVLIQWWGKAEDKPYPSPTIDFRSLDSDFINYAKKEGFYDGLFHGLGGTAGKVVTTGKKVVDTAGDIVETAGDAVQFIGKNSKLLLIGALVIIGFIIFMNVKKAAQ